MYAGRGSDWEPVRSSSCWGQSCWPGSGSNRAAFVSRGRRSPCDQSCHSLFGQTTQGDSRGGTGGCEGLWVGGCGGGGAPPPSTLRTNKWHSRHGWLITQSALWLALSHVATVTARPHEEDRGVCLEAGSCPHCCCSEYFPHFVAPALKLSSRKRSSDKHLLSLLLLRNLLNLLKFFFLRFN